MSHIVVCCSMSLLFIEQEAFDQVSKFESLTESAMGEGIIMHLSLPRSELG